jgi:hypothetical protein
MDDKTKTRILGVIARARAEEALAAMLVDAIDEGNKAAG